MLPLKPGGSLPFLKQVFEMCAALRLAFFESLRYLLCGIFLKNGSDGRMGRVLTNWESQEKYYHADTTSRKTIKEKKNGDFVLFSLSMTIYDFYLPLGIKRLISSYPSLTNKIRPHPYDREFIQSQRSRKVIFTSHNFLVVMVFLFLLWLLFEA